MTLVLEKITKLNKGTMNRSDTMSHLFITIYDKYYRASAPRSFGTHLNRRRQRRCHLQPKPKLRHAGAGIVAHEMICIIYYMLKRNKPCRGENKKLTERKFKNLERIEFNYLQN